MFYNALSHYFYCLRDWEHPYFGGSAGPHTFVIPFFKHLQRILVSFCRDLYAYSVIRYWLIWFWKEISSFFNDHHLLTSSCLVCVTFLFFLLFHCFCLRLVLRRSWTGCRLFCLCFPVLCTKEIRKSYYMIWNLKYQSVSPETNETMGLLLIITSKGSNLNAESRFPFSAIWILFGTFQLFMLWSLDMVKYLGLKYFLSQLPFSWLFGCPCWVFMLGMFILKNDNWKLLHWC